MLRWVLLAGLLATPAVAQDSPAGKLTAFVTNRYLSDFMPLREDITRLEVLNACGAEDLLASYLDRLVALETKLKRDVIAAVDGLTEEGLPEAERRRDHALTLLEAIELVDATTRGTMVDLAVPEPSEAVCATVRDQVLAQLEAPQPTSAEE